MRDVLMVIHIIGAAVWLGASATQLVVAPMLTRQSPEVAAAWMTASMNLSKKLYPIAGGLVVAAGIGLVLVSDVFQFSDLFVTIGFVVIIAAAILGARVFTPVAAAAAEAYQAGDVAAGRLASAKIARFGILDTALVVVAIVVMVTRWGA